MDMSNKYPLVILEGRRHRHETKLLQGLKEEKNQPILGPLLRNLNVFCSLQTPVTQVTTE